MDHEDLIVLETTGNAENLLVDGQVTATLLCVWRLKDDSGATPDFTKFEKVTMTLGYEPGCTCGADALKRSCVHIVAFWMRLVGLEPSHWMVWQVAFTTTELLEVAKIFKESCALQIDSTGYNMLKDLKNEEIAMVIKGEQKRSAADGRGEAFGSSLKQIKLAHALEAGPNATKKRATTK